MNIRLQIFASVGCTQAIIGELNPTYNMMYKDTLSWFPAFSFAFSIGILLVMVLMLAYCIWFWRKLIALQEKAQREADARLEADSRQEDVCDTASDTDSYDEFDAKAFEFAKKIRSFSIWSASEISIKL